MSNDDDRDAADKGGKVIVISERDHTFSGVVVEGMKELEGVYLYSVSTEGRAPDKLLAASAEQAAEDIARTFEALHHLPYRTRRSNPIIVELVGGPHLPSDEPDPSAEGGPVEPTAA